MILLRVIAMLLLLGLLPGCASVRELWPFGREPAGPAPDLEQGLSVADTETVVAFYERAQTFYGRLAHRRFNDISTYRDEQLRDYFRSEAAFSDYYAGLAQALAEAHFERNRPLTLDVVEFRLAGPGEAEVVTRMVGENGLPLRRGNTDLERTDRWERLQGTWWIIPGKL
ncbi:MAG: hypothetical protein CL910_20750 [Deltaproteobacteria bacterium]|jgi:hypothetical protein|nr:hypothetical protein [Deltaproteobacteria bacterium]